MAFAEGRVGPVIIQEGTPHEVRLARMGALVTTDAHGRYWEAASRGFLFAVASQTGATTQAGLSATTPGLTLFNPKNSGVNASLVYVGGVYIVAFAAAAAIWLAVNTNVSAADVTGTAVTSNQSSLLGNNAQSKCKVFTAATLPAAPIAIATLGVALTGAVTTVPGMPTFGREFAGSITLAPGSAVSVQTSTASGTTSFFTEYIWEEIPL